jgi:steroid 5-alpha reductase family enzyme
VDAGYAAGGGGNLLKRSVFIHVYVLGLGAVVAAAVCIWAVSLFRRNVGIVDSAWSLMRVSGVALLEKDIGERRPKYAEYMRRTNAFFPGKPKPQ